MEVTPPRTPDDDARSDSSSGPQTTPSRSRARRASRTSRTSDVSDAVRSVHTDDDPLDDYRDDGDDVGEPKPTVNVLDEQLAPGDWQDQVRWLGGLLGCFQGWF